MTGSVGFVSTLSNSANVFVVGLYQVNSDGSLSLLETQIPTKAGSVPYYTTPFQVTFATNLLAGTVYRAVLWENATAVVGGLSRISGDLSPTASATTLRSDEYLTYGTDSQFTSTTQIVDSSLIGWNISLENKGEGTMHLGEEYTYDNTTGTINFLLQTMQPGQVVIIHFLPKVATTAASSPSLITSGIIITNNRTLDNTYVNKALILQGASAYMIEILPALSTITDFQMLIFYSMGGSHLNASIRCAGTDKIQRNTQVSKVVLGQNECLKIYKAFGVWQVDYCSPGVDQVGQLLEGLYGSEINTLKMDGSVVSRATYERLWDKAQLINTFIVEASWNNVVAGGFINKGFFTSGDGSTNFRLPNLTVYGFRKGNNSPGLYTPDDVKPHVHEEQVFTAANNGGRKPVGYSGTLSDFGPSGYDTLTNDGTVTQPNSTGVFILIRI